ncbi:MAG TPA: zinc ribbon domain-containing protein [Planctomycetota bacterium]|nr:zinc ribbon domain-containing protein [Planctomycetota bacterium]
MPTYEYECDGCGHRFEKYQSIKAAPVRKCPACGAAKVRRLIGSGGAVLFKGSGFYTTDYRSKEYQEKASADKPPSTGKDKPGDEAPSKDKKPGSSDKS